MDGTLAIERNLQALKRIVANLVGMAGLRRRFAPEAQSWRAGGTTTGGEGRDAAEGSGDPARTRPVDSPSTLPRHLRLAILRLLRPAESAARRLIIAAARGIVVTLPPLRARKPKPAAADPMLRRFGIAVTLSPSDVAPARTTRTSAPHPEVLTSGQPRRALPLFDRLRPFRSNARRSVPPHAAPRIMLPGIAEPHRLPPPPSHDDPIDATRLTQRLASLAAALDDIEGQARRFVRLQARRKQAPSARRIWPLRPGRPPGQRAAINRREAVHDILEITHGLAFWALEPRDTS